MATRHSFSKSLQCACKGFLGVLKNERNFQIEIVALLVNVFLIVFWKVSAIESIIILLICFLVLSAELFNSAIEKFCDFVHPNHHQVIGYVKDVAAAAVLILAFSSLVIGLIIYLPYFIEFIN
ncbi:MAG: diacylglycerol kinase family protein [Bacteroidetes bacterium]|nr:diacylglycerol kinase family protein [Bacteroidota bacterium]